MCNFSKMMSTIRKLGPIAFATYTSISVVSFSSWMTAFYFGLDHSFVEDKLNSIQSYFGYSPSPHSSLDKLSQKTKGSDIWETFGTIILLSVVAHKLILPVRLGLTMALTPHVNRQLIKRNIDLYAWARKKI